MTKSVWSAVLPAFMTSRIAVRSLRAAFLMFKILYPFFPAYIGIHISLAVITSALSGSSSGVGDLVKKASPL